MGNGLVGVSGMNGAQPQPRQQIAETDMLPVITVSQFALTWDHIVKLGTLVFGAIMSAYAAGWIFVPAKQTELEALTRVVQVLQTGQAETREAVGRLTLAVDNLASKVVELRDRPAPRAPAAPKRP